jgi:hypothetical protein
MMKKTLVALAAVAVTGGAFAQATLTGEVAYGFASTTAANSTLSGFGLEAADFTIATAEDIEGVGKVAASINLDASGGRSSSATTGDVTISLTLANGLKIAGGSTQGASYLGQGLASAGAAYEWNMSGKILGSRTTNDYISFSMPLMEGTKVTYTHTEADVAIGTGSASALNTTTQAYDTISLDYTAGALAANVQARTYNQQVASSTSSASSRSRAAASYDLGVAKIGAGVENTNYMYGNSKSDSAFGLTIPMGAANIGGQFVSTSTSGNATASSNYTRTGAIFGGTYSLSKRTYAVAQYYSYDAGSTVSNTSGYIFALYNTF